MSRIDSIMEDTSDDVSTEQVEGSDRISSIMDMDYEVEEKTAEPEDKGLKSEHTPTGEKEVQKKEEKEDKEEKKEKKEEKEDEEKEEKEEEKKEEGKRKYKYKVDGEVVEEELSDEEVAAAISGRKAIQKRFTELDKEKKQVFSQKKELDETVNYVKNEMSQLRDSFESVITEFSKTGFVNKNPVDGVFNLLDKMGLDAKEYDKALFFHFIPEVAKFLDMDDTAREAYLLKKENGWLQKERDKISQKEKETSEYRSNLEKENSAKRQAGLSEESFNELKEELETKFGLENLKTEQVIKWSREKPFYDRAEKISELVPGTDIVKVARILIEYPETTDEWMLDKLGYKQVLKEKAKEEFKGKIPPKVSKAKGYDEDEDDELFKQLRRR